MIPAIIAAAMAVPSVISVVKKAMYDEDERSREVLQQQLQLINAGQIDQAQALGDAFSQEREDKEIGVGEVASIAAGVLPGGALARTGLTGLKAAGLAGKAGKAAAAAGGAGRMGQMAAGGKDYVKALADLAARGKSAQTMTNVIPRIGMG